MELRLDWEQLVELVGRQSVEVDGTRIVITQPGAQIMLMRPEKGSATPSLLSEPGADYARLVQTAIRHALRGRNRAAAASRYRRFAADEPRAGRNTGRLALLHR